MSTQDGMGNITSFQYNPRNELVQETLPDPDGAGPQAAPVLAWTYDENGNVLTYANALSQTTSETWDKLDRLVSETLPAPAQGQSAPVTTFGYDNDSRKVSQTNALSGTTSWAYGNTDITQVTSMTLPAPGGSGQGPTTTYGYAWPSIPRASTPFSPRKRSPRSLKAAPSPGWRTTISARRATTLTTPAR